MRFNQDSEPYDNVAVRRALQKAVNKLGVTPAKKKTRAKVKAYKRAPEKVHWDFLLAEMKWMSKDFKNEAKLKRQKVCTDGDFDFTLNAMLAV